MVKSSPSSSRARTSLAIIHPLAARFNFKPHLSDVTLANILDGDTCTPISLSDFEKYLTVVEYSVENLQFLVWFKDYRERYLQLSSKPAGSSSRNETVLDPPNQAVEIRATAGVANPKTRTQDQTQGETGRGSPNLSSSPASPNDAVSPTSLSPMLPPVYVEFALPSSAFTASTLHGPELHGFHLECSRAISTFFTPGSPRELNLDATIRETMIRKICLNCHPNVFLPIYEEVYSSLERCSLPRFLSNASTNINLPKQIYWYAFGTFNMLLGITIAILMITLVPPPEANRAWRLLPVLIFVVGGGQFYSAWRGSCGQIERRGMTQLRIWEMQEMDTEAKFFVEGILNQDSTASQSVIALQEKPEPEEIDMAAIAPFAIETHQIGGTSRPSTSSDSIPSYAIVPPVTAKEVHDLRRAPIFGPETVVLDPRIKAVHRQIVIDVYRFGAYLLLISSAVAFSVPGHSHPRS